MNRHKNKVIQPAHVKIIVVLLLRSSNFSTLLNILSNNTLSRTIRVEDSNNYQNKAMNTDKIILTNELSPK